MQLSAKDPIITSVITWIETDEIDLQPEFQRGMVWGRDKQQLLIDTIFRNWQIPPVFVISDDITFKKEVLDGQQRLRSIFDFYKNEFPINGRHQPSNEALERLHGMYYSELPVESKRQFLNFSLRVFEITKYSEGEPFELFYRLNQSVKLTSAERRNTFHGETRTQVKSLVQFMEVQGYNRELIGFNNSRLSYHDVIARLCFVLEQKSFEVKITDKDITNRYRSSSGFSPQLIARVESSLLLLRDTIKLSGKLKLSKPTLFSWLTFITQLDGVSSDKLASFVNWFRGLIQNAEAVGEDVSREEAIRRWVMKEYVYRASTSVNDSKSILFRHFALSHFWFETYGSPSSNPELLEKINKITPAFKEDFTEDEVYSLIGNSGLGILK
jgi:hypothetical protein